MSLRIPTTAFTRRAAYNLVFGAIAAALVFFCGFPLSHASARQALESGLTAHEWGTFTSVSNSDGRAIHWLALSGSTDLPSFVERLGDANFKGGLLGTMRMETPVIYFYSPRATTVSVRATFSKGLITEWFPHASVPALDPRKDITLFSKVTDGSIAWNSVHVAPGGSIDFPADASENHYYAARQTSSAPLAIDTPSGAQHERFLFYRGVTALVPPLTASVTKDGTIVLRNAVPNDEVPLPGSSSPLTRTGNTPSNAPLPKAAELQFRKTPKASGSGLEQAKESATPDEIPNLILFERRGSRLGYRIVGPLADQASFSPPALDGSLEALFSDLEGILIAQGLFPDEAHAMLETWRDSWFEEGSRILYVVPRAFVDSVLPLTITPAPAQLTRVFVGRVELVTSITQQVVESAFASRDGTTLAKYNRFLEPILNAMIQSSADPVRRRRLGDYLGSTYRQSNR
jgi:hypothetical protein